MKGGNAMRTFWIVLLTCGFVGGLVAGITSLHHRTHHHHSAFEDHIADVCVRAAARLGENEGS